MLPQGDRRARQLHRWFLFSGGTGLALAIILADLFRHDLMGHDLGSATLLRLLWPASKLSGALGSNVAAQLLDGLLMYGGQFLLYGTVGLLVALLASSSRSTSARGLSGNKMGPERRP